MKKLIAATIVMGFAAGASFAAGPELPDLGSVEAQLKSSDDANVPHAYGRHHENRRTEVPCPTLPSAVAIARSDGGHYGITVNGKPAGAVEVAEKSISIVNESGETIALAEFYNRPGDSQVPMQQRRARVTDCNGAYLGDVEQIVVSAASFIAIHDAFYEPVATSVSMKIGRSFYLKTFGKGFYGPILASVRVKETGERENGLAVETYSSAVDESLAMVAAVMNDQIVDLVKKDAQERKDLELNLPRHGPQGMDRGR